jgi:hypothetical protein
MPEPIFMKLGTYEIIIAPEPISTVYFINTFHQSMYMHAYPLSLLVNGWIKNVTAATNTRSKREELLDASFFIRSVSYQRKVGE